MEGIKLPGLRAIGSLQVSPQGDGTQKLLLQGSEFRVQGIDSVSKEIDFPGALDD